MSSRQLTESQLIAINSLPDHEEATIPTCESKNPASFYTDETRYQLEKERLLKRAPIPLTLSAMLPEPNMAYAHNGFGVPIILTRDRDGEVHAFLNACTHRGSKLMNDGEDSKKCGRITCPFHAWSFDLQGKLLGLPRAEVFPTLEKSEMGLRRLHNKEAGGIIWVGLDPNYEVDFSEAINQLADDFNAFGLKDMHVYRRKTYDLAANWKIMIETFLETYHVPPLHKNTVAPHFAEVPTIIDYLGLHSRQTTGRSHFKKAEANLDIDEMFKSITHAYQIFPTAVLVTSPYHINFITMMPRAANRTMVECYMVTKGPPETDKAKELFDRTFEFNMTSVFGEEDFWAATQVQAGLESGALDFVSFGGLENALTSLHEAINSYVDKEI